MTENTPGTLNVGEFHPAAHIAHKFIIDHVAKHNPLILLESLASSALAGSRMAEIASETLQRLLSNEPVSDRYLMGLAWILWDMEQP